MLIHSKLAVLLLVLTLCGQVHTETIIGGQETQKHSRPYMALLEMEMEVGHKGHCGGFLLNEDFVMTAAHCKAKKYKVFLGLHNYHDQNGVQKLSVERDFPHEDFHMNDYENDIMLLKLSSKANISDSVKAITLADRDDSSLPQSCTVSGWGQTTAANGHMSSNLMEVSVTLVENEKCDKKKTYCSRGKKGPGVGDSGGPLVCKDEKVYGVVSAGDKKVSPSGLHMYTKIPDKRDWIDGIMQNNGRL